MTVIRGILIALMLWLTLSALMAPFGYFLVLPWGFDRIDLIGSQLRFMAIRSATFLTLAYFIFNYLRHRKPLSSVAPLLVFNNFLIAVSTVSMMIDTTLTIWQDWAAMGILCCLAPLLFLEHKKESKTIFVSDW
jgi:hypothetical protein